MGGNIDLNSKKYESSGPAVFKDDVLAIVSDKDIFTYYLPATFEFILGRAIHSPLRPDNKPSFSFFVSVEGKILFKDHARNQVGDCFSFVKEKYNLPSYAHAIRRVWKDMCEGRPEAKELGVSLEGKKKNFSKPSRKKIQIKSRDWYNHDVYWWGTFGISVETLKKFNVLPISYFWVTDINTGKTYIQQGQWHCYAYRESKDGVVTYKIYQPKSKNNKWISNVNRSVHQGYTQLPETGKLLIITKSLKDVMSIYETLGIAAIGLQGENVAVKPEVMEEYKRRFERVVVLFDSDPPGVVASSAFSEEFGIKNIIIPERYGSKDYSDLVRDHGKRIAVGTLINLLTNDTNKSNN